VATHAEADPQNKRRDFWSFSRSDAGWLVVWYVIAFLICRFDIGKHHTFEHPMPTAKAAWVAIPLALLIAVLVKIRNR
jgi:uncharacterized protein with PQ loop repeat